MSFTTLLIQLCKIQSKSLSTTGYEQIQTWTDAYTNVPCRKNTKNSVKIVDTEIRDNIDDDMFFMNPTTVIVRGNRIVFDNENYDVIKVNKVYDSKALHHLEVIARLVNQN